MMRRVMNWDIALFDWARSVCGEPYVWGRTDCASLVREAHRLMYGEGRFDVGEWTSKTGALRVSKRVGGVVGALEAAGAEDVHPGKAQQGDVLVRAAEDADGHPVCGVLIARRVLSSDPERGVWWEPYRGVVADRVLRVPYER